MTVYLDHNATTPPSREVRALIHDSLDNWGNASSIHFSGRRPKSMLREARQNLARLLKVDPLELVFTSGGSESNNAVIKSVFDSSSRSEFITSQIEHPSVIKSFRYLEALGAKVHFVPVSRDGELDLEFYQSVLSEETALVSIMLANNETGTILPVRELAEMAHAKGALFHSDCVQALGKLPVNLQDLGVDFATFSAHKFYALKGTGLLYIKRNTPFEPLVHGGGQERHRRGGTENTLGIFALGVQARKLGLVADQMKRVQLLRDHFESRVLRDIPDAQVTAKNGPRLPNTSSLVIAGVDGETLLMSLDLKGYAVSTGAACSSGNPEPSPVLLAMGLTRDEAQSSLRVSLGWETSFEDLDGFFETLRETVRRLRRLSEQGVSNVVHP